MNIYEQLEAVKTDLRVRGAKPQTMLVIDKMLARAEAQRDSGLGISRLQLLRHVMSTPDVLNDEEVRLDFLALQGDLEDEAAQRAETRPAYDDVDRRPKLKKFYKKK